MKKDTFRHHTFSCRLSCLIFRIAGPVLLSACWVVSGLLSGCRHEPTPADIAGKAALGYYERLLQKDFKGFVAGYDRPEAIPDVYASQLRDNMDMFLAQQVSERGGIDSVILVRASADSLGEMARAYLMLYYADSTREEIVVPMVRRGEQWLMR